MYTYKGITIEKADVGLIVHDGRRESKGDRVGNTLNPHYVMTVAEALEDMAERLITKELAKSNEIKGLADYIRSQVAELKEWGTKYPMKVA